jgi:SulP family sulfate permease
MIKDVDNMVQGLRSLLSGLRIRRSDIGPDLVAGATFAIVNVPQGMANAVLAAANPVAGLYSLMIAMPVGAVFTSSVFMNVSTTGALSVAAGDILSPLPEEQKLPTLIGLVMLIGLIQLGFGLLGLGRLIRFVSNAVMTGFLTGIAVLIMLGALRDVTGYASRQPNPLLRLADTAMNWRLFDMPTLGLGLATVALIFAFHRTALRKFALLLALVVATIVAFVAMRITNWGTMTLVGDVASIPRSLPVPHMPSLEALPELLFPALAIALIGLIQGAGVGQSYPNPDGNFPDTSRDFTGQGLANLAASFFGAIPSGGSISGTAICVQAGARTRWTNIFAGAFIVVIVVFLAGLVALVPMAGLGGLLLVVGYQNIQPENIRNVWRTGRSARLIMCLTLAATLVVPLQYAILAGVVLSFVSQVLRSANDVVIREILLVDGGFPHEGPVPAQLRPGQVTALRVSGSLFFASALELERQLPATDNARGTAVILILRDIDDLGSTVIRVLKRYAQNLQQQGGKLVLAGVNETLLGQLQRTGVTDLIGIGNLFPAKAEIGFALNQAILAAKQWTASAASESNRTTGSR